MSDPITAADLERLRELLNQQREYGAAPAEVLGVLDPWDELAAASIRALPAMLAAAEERDRLREEHEKMRFYIRDLHREADRLRARDRILAEIEKMAAEWWTGVWIPSGLLAEATRRAALAAKEDVGAPTPEAGEADASD